MMQAVTSMESDSDDEVHVFPIFGPDHILDGLRCWCHPERDRECVVVIVHQVMN